MYKCMGSFFNRLGEWWSGLDTFELKIGPEFFFFGGYFSLDEFRGEWDWICVVLIVGMCRMELEVEEYFNQR